MEYLVNVGVHGVTNLTFGEGVSGLPNPFVSVTVFGETRETRSESQTSSCSFDYYFSFVKREKPTEFMSSDCTVGVYHSKALPPFRDPIGEVVFSLRLVWGHARQTVPKCWVPIYIRDQPSEIRGFVQLTIGAYSPGCIIPRLGFDVDAGDDEQHGDCMRARVMQKPTMELNKSLFQLRVMIFSAEKLRKLSGTVRDSCDPAVEVEFNGTRQWTNTMPDTTAPSWNQEVRVPFSMPCWDDSINIRLYSMGGALGSNTLLGKTCLYVNDLSQADLAPTWYNFYYSPEDAGAGYFAKAQEPEASEFAGRLLVAAAKERGAGKPQFLVTACAAEKQPATSKAVLWVDAYEIVFDLAQLPGAVKATIAMQPHLEEQELEQPARHNMSFDWKGNGGRLNNTFVQLPGANMCGDVIVVVHTKEEGGWFEGGFTRHMYVRCPVSSVFNWEVRPKWFEMRSVQGERNHKIAGFALMSVNIGLEAKMPARPPRANVQLKPYKFRALIYQAVNLPCKDAAGTTDPLIVIFFGPAMLRTSVLSQSVNPSWYEVHEAEVELPQNEGLRPDIIMYVVDQDEEDIEAICQLRYSTIEKGALPEAWPGPPRWLNLEKVENGPVTQGRVLCAFELAPQNADPPPTDIRPPVVSCRVEVFIIGVRMKGATQHVENPVVELAWGRKKENPALPIKEAYTETAKEGDAGQFNFLEKVSMTCKLVKDHHYQEFVEVKLLSESSDGKSMNPVAFGVIHLTALFPWLTSMQRAAVRKAFKIRTHEDLKVESAMNEFDHETHADEMVQHTHVGSMQESRKSLAPLGDPSASSAHAHWKVVQEMVSPTTESHILEERLCKALGWDFDSIEASNATASAPLEFANITEEDAKECEEVLKDMTKVSDDIFKEFERSFTWPTQTTDEADGLDGHPDLDGELEFPEELLPYSRTPLFVGSEWGEQVTIGTMKFCCRIVERERHKRGGPEVEAEDLAWENRIGDLFRRFNASHQLTIRVYVLSADALIPKSGDHDPNTFVWSKTSTSPTDSGNKDISCVRMHSAHPEFNKCHNFEGCELPQSTFLHVSIFEQQAGVLGGGEEVIGTTIIDIEDRWFHPTYHEMISSEAVPIETRNLHTTDSYFGRGHLRLWIDIMTTEQGNTQPLIRLPSADPAPFQLRIVIWKVSQVSLRDGEKPDVYVVGEHKLDDGTTIRKQTDTHYGCDDNLATFNWRFLFDVTVPCRDPRLQLFLWDKNFISFSEPMAEATLDLTRDFLQARKTNTAQELPRGHVKFMHPSFPGHVRGILDIEGMVLPLEEALLREVGEERNEPNEDPFLDGEDPHILAHRSAVGDVAGTLKYVGGFLFAGFGMMTAMYVLAAVAGAVVSLITMIAIIQSAGS